MTRPQPPTTGFKITIETRKYRWNKIDKQNDPDAGYWHDYSDEVYIQQVDTIDLLKIIAAVNGWEAASGT